MDYGFGMHGELCQVMSNEVYNGSGSLVSYCEADYIPDGGLGNYSHGWLGQLTNTFWTNSGYQWTGTTLSENQYSYDTGGDRLTNTITLNGATRTETYGYDELNRLTSVDYGDGGTQAYSFDDMGNRLEKDDSVSGDESYTYNAANMLLNRGSNSCSNDPDGNTLTGGGRMNTWDSQNRLVNCVYGSNTSSYIYGADGFRHQSTVNGTTTDFALDGRFFVREMQGGAQYATYLTGPTGPLYRRDASGETLRWYVYDGLGSVLGEVDTSGNLDATRTYDVYGLARSVTGTPTSKHAWVGVLGHTSEGETGLVYMRARYMDPAVGRFASEDPGMDGSNWYLYCDNNPTNESDDSGRLPHLIPPGVVDFQYLMKYGQQCLPWLKAEVWYLLHRGKGDIDNGAKQVTEGQGKEGQEQAELGPGGAVGGQLDQMSGGQSMISGADAIATAIELESVIEYIEGTEDDDN